MIEIKSSLPVYPHWQSREFHFHSSLHQQNLPCSGHCWARCTPPSPAFSHPCLSPQCIFHPQQTPSSCASPHQAETAETRIRWEPWTMNIEHDMIFEINHTLSKASNTWWAAPITSCVIQYLMSYMSHNMDNNYWFHTGRNMPMPSGGSLFIPSPLTLLSAAWVHPWNRSLWRCWTCWSPHPCPG